MRETQQSICEWADATFGVPVSDVSIAARALEVMAKLVTACAYGEPAERIGEEIADVVIVLARLGRSIGLDMIEMARNGAAASEGTPTTLALQTTDRLIVTAMALENGWPTSLGAVQVWLMRLARRVGVSLPAAIDAKMAINRSRRWRLDGNGHGQHVEEPEPSLEEKFRARLASMTPEECHAALQRVRDFIDREPLEAVPRCPSCGDVELPPGWRVCGACFLREGP